MTTSSPDQALDATLPISGIALSPAPPFARERRAGRLDHFVVERPLGAGGMGEIYLGRDTSLERPVAIKILPDELAASPEAQERFVREARAQARLQSPHVVQIFFIGRVPPAANEGSQPPSPGSHQGSLYFAMERVDGESLEARLDRGELFDADLARRLMIQVARGLRDAHRAGIIHRDIKPGNLLVDGEEHLKVADFGLAKPSDPNLSLTRGNTVMGTPYYMAPEQALGEPLDHRADMYSIGCTFHHLLAGEPPFDGPSQMAVIAKHLKEKPTPIRQRAPRVPPRLAGILDRLLEKEPAKRFPTYEALIHALEEAAPGRVEYAGFWARGAALMIDSVAASLLIGLLGPAGLLVHLALVTAGLAYRGQTLGKYLLRIQVQRLDGSPLGLPRAFARSLASMWLPVFLGVVVLVAEGFSGLRGSIAGLARPEGYRALVILAVSNGVLALLYALGLVVAAVQRQKRAAHDFLVGSCAVYHLTTPASTTSYAGKARP